MYYIPKNKDGSIDERQYYREQSALWFMEYMLRRVAYDRILKQEFKHYNSELMDLALEYIMNHRGWKNMPEAKICFSCKKKHYIFDPEGELCNRCLNNAKMSFSSWKNYRQKKATKHSIYWLGISIIGRKDRLEKLHKF